MIITNENIFDFARMYDWSKKLDTLEGLIIAERWSFMQPNLQAKNQKNPILANYIQHTFIRTHHLITASPEDESLYVAQNEDTICLNTGLYTSLYERVYLLFRQEEKPDDDKKYAFIDFVKESDYRLFDYEQLPKRPSFFEKVDDLIYDTSLELRINSAHILADPNNVERIPEAIRSDPNLQTLFDGALVQVQKRIDGNYKIAVPQYYNGQVQLLLPLCLVDPQKEDLVLAVTRKKNSYAGRTCLTLDMAYNNARLIAKPETPWLTRNV